RRASIKRGETLAFINSCGFLCLLDTKMTRTHLMTAAREDVNLAINTAVTATPSARAIQVLGHYARPMERAEHGLEPDTTIAIAALAAFETCARLGRYLPVTVDSQMRRDSARVSSAAPYVTCDAGVPRNVAHWTEWRRDEWCTVPIADAL